MTKISFWVTTVPTTMFKDANSKSLSCKHDDCDTSGSFGTTEIHSPTDALPDFVAIHVQKTVKPAGVRQRLLASHTAADIWLHVSNTQASARVGATSSSLT